MKALVKSKIQTQMRTIAGNIIVPANAPAVKAGLILIEVRDTSLADAPSTVIAQQELTNIALKPNGRIAFNLRAPEVAPNRSLSMRVHVSLDGSGIVKSGNLLTTASYSVPNVGDTPNLEIHVVVI